MAHGIVGYARDVLELLRHIEHEAAGSTLGEVKIVLCLIALLGGYPRLLGSNLRLLAG